MYKTRICPRCGTHNASNASLCSKADCGKRLSSRNLVRTSSGLGLLNRQLDAEKTKELGAAARGAFFGGAVIGAAAGLVLTGLAYVVTLLVESLAPFRPFILEYWWVPPVVLGTIVGLVVGWILTEAVRKAIYK
jgi:hypothetical protein